MEKLKANWLTEGLIDFEYKKYMLLAYFKYAKQEFGHQKLYPVLADLIFHYQNLKQLKEQKQLLNDSFPKELQNADLEKLKLSYKKIVNDGEMMGEIEDIIAYALPHFSSLVNNGKEIYDYVESHLEINPVGITPVYFGEGYVLLNEYNIRDVKVFRYQITIFSESAETFRAVHWTYMDSIERGIATTYENIKIQLIRRHQDLPNPATFMIQAKVPCPLQETLLPIAKRTLVRHITQLGLF